MKKRNTGSHIAAIRAAFPHTLPIMAGFLVLGASYGILMAGKGFSFLYPMIMSLTIFAGSMEFTMANVLVGAFNPAEAFMLAIMINARHLFYGISMAEKYRGQGVKKIYMIFALCDETFSVNYSAEPPEGVDRGLFMFYTSLLDQAYWVTGATLGGIFGGMLPTVPAGFDFAMTAMFVCILLEQLLEGVRNLPSVLIGVGASLASLLVFGPDGFILPAMGIQLLALSVLRRPIERLNTLGGDAK